MASAVKSLSRQGTTVSYETTEEIQSKKSAGRKIFRQPEKKKNIFKKKKGSLSPTQLPRESQDSCETDRRQSLLVIVHNIF
jgi:hypothetical protein